VDREAAVSARLEYDAPQYAAAARVRDPLPFDLEAATAKSMRSVTAEDVLDQLHDVTGPLHAAMVKRDPATIGRIVLAVRDHYARELALIGEYGAGHPSARQTLTLEQVAAMACYPAGVVL
jgi:hypothetical protein